MKILGIIIGILLSPIVILGALVGVLWYAFMFGFELVRMGLGGDDEDLGLPGDRPV